MNGVVADQGGSPIAGAKVTRLYGFYEEQAVSTDASGYYELQFSAVRGVEHGPAGTEDAVSMVSIEAPGYDYLLRYLIAPANEIVQNFRLHGSRRLTPGESTQLTIGPDDSVCGSDWWPGRERLCRTLRILVPTDGAVSIEVLPLDANSSLASMAAWVVNSGGLPGSSGKNPAVLNVSAGSEVRVDVGVGWGATSNQSFLIKTAMLPLPASSRLP